MLGCDAIILGYSCLHSSKIILKKNLKPRCRHMMTMSLPQLEKHKRAHKIGLFAEHVVHQYTYG